MVVRMSFSLAASRSMRRRSTSRRSHDWTTKHWMPSGRLGLHAYAVEYGVEWERYWRETEPGALARLFDAIVKELEQAAPAIAILVEKKKRENEELRLKREVEHQALYVGGGTRLFVFFSTDGVEVTRTYLLRLES